MQALLTAAAFPAASPPMASPSPSTAPPCPPARSVLYAGDSLVIAFDPGRWPLRVVIIYIVMSMSSCNEEGRQARDEGRGRPVPRVGTWCSSCIRILGACVACIEHTTGGAASTASSRASSTNRAASRWARAGAPARTRLLGLHHRATADAWTLRRWTSRVLCLHRPDAAQRRNDPGQQRRASPPATTDGEMPMKAIMPLRCSPHYRAYRLCRRRLRHAGARCAPGDAGRPSRRPTGRATASSPADGRCDHERFGATSPIFIDVTTEKRYAQPGCSR